MNSKLNKNKYVIALRQDRAFSRAKFDISWNLFKKAKIFDRKLICKIKGTLSCLRQFLATESSVNMIKNAFCFTLKALFVLEKFKYSNSVMRKIRLVSKFITSQSGKQTIAIHILTKISRRKGNQTIKFGQFTINIFLEKSYTKYRGETIPRPFSKNQNWLYLRSKVFYSLFLLFIACQVEFNWSILKLSCGPLAFSSFEVFLKNKKRSGTSLLDSFSAWYLKKNIFLVIFYFY